MPFRVYVRRKKEMAGRGDSRVEKGTDDVEVSVTN